jgi:hypothetical protein
VVANLATKSSQQSAKIGILPKSLLSQKLAHGSIPNTMLKACKKVQSQKREVPNFSQSFAAIRVCQVLT